MALVDSALAAELVALYNDMGSAPMDAGTFADRFAAIIDAQTKTASVKAGIAVDGGTASGGALVGCMTSATGSLE